MRLFALLPPVALSLVTLAACHSDVPSTPSDLAAPRPDLSAAPDAAVATDLAAPADLAPPPRDLSTSPDLTRTVGSDCGGFAGWLCPGWLYCDYPDQCGNSDELGVCTERPMICDAIFDPVCGCDFKQYGNDCERQKAGVSRRDKGICGCQAPCGKGFHCAACKMGPMCIPDGVAC